MSNLGGSGRASPLAIRSRDQGLLQSCDNVPRSPELAARENREVLLRLFLLLTIVPFVELVILLRIAEQFRWGPTILLVIATGAVGAWLARREGLKALSRIQAELERGVMPTTAMVDGALILAAGLVLVTPGILTDLLGLALLVPLFRRWVRKRMVDAFKRQTVVMHFGDQGASRDDDTFVDVDATSVDVERDTDKVDPSTETPQLESDDRR